MKTTTLSILAGTILSLVAAQAAMAEELSTAPATTTEAPAKAKHATKHAHAAKHHSKKAAEKKL